METSRRSTNTDLLFSNSVFNAFFVPTTQYKIVHSHSWPCSMQFVHFSGWGGPSLEATFRLLSSFFAFSLIFQDLVLEDDDDDIGDKDETLSDDDDDHMEGWTRLYNQHNVVATDVDFTTNRIQRKKDHKISNYH